MPPFGAALTFFRRRRWHFLSLCSRSISSPNRPSRSFDREFLRRWPFSLTTLTRCLSLSLLFPSRPFAHVREFPSSLKASLSIPVRGFIFQGLFLRAEKSLFNRLPTRPNRISLRRRASARPASTAARCLRISNAPSNSPSLQFSKTHC